MKDHVDDWTIEYCLWALLPIAAAVGLVWTWDSTDWTYWVAAVGLPAFVWGVVRD